MTKQILVVEDEPKIAMALEFLMKQQGYRVRSADNGVAAIEEVSRDPPDILLLDIKIPGRSGFEVCKTVRANPTWNATKILILTGNDREADRTRALALGADAYVTKPFATKDVIAEVKGLLGE